jgi:hypothetical protein
MLSDRHRILELALVSLENKKRQIDQEIADITREFRGAGTKTATPSAKAAPGAKPATGRKQLRFSKEERLRRSERMRAYWQNWRKKKSRQK